MVWFISDAMAIKGSLIFFSNAIVYVFLIVIIEKLLLFNFPRHNKDSKTNNNESDLAETKYIR